MCGISMRKNNKKILVRFLCIKIQKIELIAESRVGIVVHSVFMEVNHV
jgi:hypothetical protein